MKTTFFYSASHAAYNAACNAARELEYDSDLEAALTDNGDVVAFTNCCDGIYSYVLPKLKSSFPDYEIAGHTTEEDCLLVTALGVTEKGQQYAEDHGLPPTSSAILGCAVNLQPKP